MTAKKPPADYLFENLMNNMTDCIYFKDLQSRFVMVNQAFADKHGWKSPDEAKGHSDFDDFARVHAERAFADEQRIIKTGEPLFNIEEKEPFPDGTFTWASTTKMPWKNDAGEIIGTFGVSRDITKRKIAELRARQAAEEMRIITEEMENDFRMAGDLQKTFLPSGYPAFPGGAEPVEQSVEFFHDYKVCLDVGGDYCSIDRVSDTEAGIFMCDVQGLGVRSALGTALIRGIIQEITPLGLDTGTYLSRVNELLMPLVHHEDVLLKVTACYLLLDTVTGKIQYSSAGHPLPILFQKGGGARWLCDGQDPCGPALADASGTTYVTREDQAAPGDAVVLYTDGLFNLKDEGDDPYGAQRLLDSAQHIAGSTLPDMIERLESDALAFAKNGAFTDDVCLAGFQLR